MVRSALVIAVLGLVVHIAGCCCCGPGIPDTNGGGFALSPPSAAPELPAPQHVTHVAMAH